MEGFGPAPIQYIHLGVFFGGLLALGGIMSGMVAIAKLLSGSRRQWRNFILPAVVFTVMGSGIVFLTLQHPPLNERDQAAFDKSNSLSSLFEEQILPYRP